MGGYISFPGGMMAALLDRPLVIHEQNCVAGLANKVLARLADKVLEGFPGSLPGAQFSGNPVRKEITELAAPGARYAARSGRLRLLVVGGSLGAQILNETVPQALALLPQGERPEVAHQSGEKNIGALRAGYMAAGVQAELLPFIDDMAARYAAADVVLCRAGALSVAELACACRARWTITRPVMRNFSLNAVPPSCCRKPNCQPGNSPHCCADSRANASPTWRERRTRLPSRTRLLP
jgi:UDP-N-acetylglucosamine--N-acetylmuramyl-(pentapeptide) pyrophosphoryl-undecaprenol N-acetylglucosamine transferase